MYIALYIGSGRGFYSDVLKVYRLIFSNYLNVLFYAQVQIDIIFFNKIQHWLD